ncbi:MAG: hypothetical protein JWO10_275 [Microbacteriaceae bacterium]|nr:hypothetical protein [Microbacteriaceae bacterium]
MADLKINLTDLELLQSRLDAALLQIESDVANTGDLQSAVGHPALSGAIEGFTHSWNKHRLDIRDNLTWLKDSLDKIGDSFVDADTELASALAPPPKAQAKSSAA